MKVKVSVKRKPFETPKNQTHMISINTAYIRLDSFLKLADAVQSGGHAKIVIQEGEVRVNGVVCMQRGKKLRSGDTVRFQQTDFEVTAP